MCTYSMYRDTHRQCTFLFPCYTAHGTNRRSNRWVRRCGESLAIEKKESFSLLGALGVQSSTSHPGPGGAEKRTQRGPDDWHRVTG